MDEEAGTTYYLECESEGNVEESWHWSNKTTRLLVDLYMLRRQKFRDPKIRKRALWTEIVEEMERAGHKGINEDICDRKWRNMKKTYRTCCEAMRKNGRKRTAWEYYEAFHILYQHEIESKEQGSVDANAMVKPEQDTGLQEVSMEDERDYMEEREPNQMFLLERSRISAIRELSRRIEESNEIQRERNELLREFLNQL